MEGASVDKWKHSTNVTAQLTHRWVSDWPRKLLIYAQVLYPMVENKMAAVTRYEIGEMFCQESPFFNIYEVDKI